MKQLNHLSWYFLVPWISWVTTTFHYFTSAKQALGSCSEDDIAVRVLMRVIGAYPKKNLLLVDSCLGNSKMISEVSWFFLRSCFFQNETCFVFFFARIWMDYSYYVLKLLNSPAPGNESYLGGVDGLVDGLSTRDCWISMNFFALKNIWNFFFLDCNIFILWNTFFLKLWTRHLFRTCKPIKCPFFTPPHPFNFEKRKQPSTLPKIVQ